MRTIEFRGKDVETGEWIYGDLFQRIGYYPEIIVSYPNDDGKIAYKSVTVRPESVGQYTNCTDTRINKIYDGDILCMKDLHKEEGPYHLLVLWDDERKCWAVKWLNRDPEFVSGNTLGDFMREMEKYFDITVAGNKYDNQELMKNM